MIDALLIDLDGVLIDSSSIHARAYKKTFELFGFDLDTNYSKFAGRSTKEVMEEIVESNNLSKDMIVKLTRTKQELSRRYFLDLDNTAILPHVKDGLRKLSKIYRLALCTSASKSTAEVLFKGGIEKELFEVILTSEDVTFSKPNPEIYCKAIDALNLKAQNVLVIEDSVAGIRSGLSSGAKVVWIKNGNEHLEDSLRNHPRLIYFEDFGEFVKSRL